MKIAIACSRFNEEITHKLLTSCLRRLAKGGVPSRSVRVVQVPGAFELPWAVNELARTSRCDAVIALGCVLRGQTPQNDRISASVFTHLHDISVATRVPVVCGVITPNTWAQAVARTKRPYDRGVEAAEAALELAELKRSA